MARVSYPSRTNAELVRSGSEPVEPVPARRIAERGAPARFGDLHPRQGAPGGAVPDRAPHGPRVRDLGRRTESLEQQHERDQEHQRLAGRVRTAGAAGSGEHEYIEDRRPHSEDHIPDHTPRRTSCRFTDLWATCRPPMRGANLPHARFSVASVLPLSSSLVLLRLRRHPE